MFAKQSQFAWLIQRQFTLHLHFVFNRNCGAQLAWRRVSLFTITAARAMPDGHPST
jgi:hypothetical protein